MDSRGGRGELVTTPNLFIVGPPRSGTTSLIEWLAEHPQIARPELKEPMFHAIDLATPHRVTDRDAYLEMYRDLGPAAFYVDATPWYLYSSMAAESIKAMAPDAHVIVHLRHPVQVLSSLHARHLIVGLEPEPDIEQAVFGGPQQHDATEFRRCLDYLAVGRFGEQAQRFTSRFPKERVHFISTRDMARRPREVHVELLGALGLEPLPLAEYERDNEAQTVRSRAWSWATAKVAGSRTSSRIRRALAVRMALLAATPGRDTLSPATAQRITKELADDIVLLAELSGRDLSDWLGT